MEASTTANGGQAQEKVQQVAGQAQEKAQEAAGEAKSRAREQVEQRSTQAGEQVSASASDLRSVAEHLRSEGKDQPAKLAEQAAERAERLGGYLKGADADRILRDVEDFGRKQPLAVMFGGLALGFAASRFLKASSQNRAGGAAREQPRTGLPAPAGTAPSTAAHDTAPQPVGAGAR
jgi:ribosomal protein S15P/S13E